MFETMRAVERMLLHLVELRLGQAAQLVEDGVRHRDLADVVQQGGELRGLLLVGGQADLASGERGDRSEWRCV